MLVSIIAAQGKNRVIGVDNDLPWRIPADMRWFKSTTMGKPVIMGRKTWDSIGRPLPGRRNIVITRQQNWAHDGAERAGSVEDALMLAGDVEEAIIMGGAEIYWLALSLAGRIYLTDVDLAPEGDALFPVIYPDEWNEVWREDHAAADGVPAFSFIKLDRRR